ncbi:histidine kinase [Chryseosolibacter indicus]|uniref:Histidine kinase n=1 Tax=Chryseosolibacter indicus TaxID=2782351 RepID=A0ABS5VV84_9BACT|nr:sensor histidine kinase [Chryseosolibacter indicus]MBT1704963.1 histidine kinase [Chryseosolibacter indicus]
MSKLPSAAFHKEIKRYFINNPLFRIIAPVIYGVLIYLLILLINNNVTQINDLFSSEEVYVCIGLSYIAFESIRFIIILTHKYLKSDFSLSRIIIQLLVTTGLTLLLVVTCLKIYFNTVYGFSISTTQLLIFTIIFIVTALLYNVLYFSNYYLQKENTIKINSEKQQQQVLEMEMMEFKNEINPDLLYESLESTIALMYRDIDQAEEYIDCLASTYRYVLTNRYQEVVTVSEEVNAARNIVRLLNEKYYGQIKFNPTFDENELDAVLVPGSLPIIIESMVRNTIVTRFEPFVINCYIEDDYLTVQAKLNERLILHETSTNAITRLQKSYTLYTDLPVIRVKAYDENYIKLPLIRIAEEV